MLYEYTTNKFLSKDKKGMDLDSFTSQFYRQLRLNRQKYEDEQFDDFLTELYMKDSSVYEDWYKAFSKISYAFTRKNTVLMTNLVSANNIEYLLLAFDMDKKKKSLIARCIPRRATVSTVGESKDKLFVELSMQLALMESEEEDNILRKAQEEFYLRYGEYENDRYLGDLYNNILDTLEEEMRNALISEINKINTISAKLTDSANIALIRDTQNATRKDRNMPKVYRKY